MPNNETSDHNVGITWKVVNGINMLFSIRELSVLVKLEEILLYPSFMWLWSRCPSKQEYHLCTFIFIRKCELYHPPMWFPKYAYMYIDIDISVIQEYATTNNQLLTLLGAYHGLGSVLRASCTSFNPHHKTCKISIIIIFILYASNQLKVTQF